MATAALTVFSRLQHRPPPLTRALWRVVVEKCYLSRAPPAPAAIAASSDPDAPTSELPELQVPAELAFSLQRLLPTGEHAVVLPPPLFFLQLRSSLNLLIFSRRDLRRTSRRSSSLPASPAPKF
jgi:hypothetical protein